MRTFAVVLVIVFALLTFFTVMLNNQIPKDASGFADFEWRYTTCLEYEGTYTQDSKGYTCSTEKN